MKCSALPPTGGIFTFITTFFGLFGLRSSERLASFAIAEPSDTTDSTRLKNIIFFIVVGFKGFITLFSFVGFLCFPIAKLRYEDAI